MILYILLIVFSILVALIALGLTIGGLVKKKRNLWIGSLATFVVFSLVTVFAIYTYVKETVNYMGSDAFQAETKKKAENMGKTWGNTVSGVSKGLNETLDDEAIAGLAKKSGTILGKGVQAFSTGLDETVGTTKVFADSLVNTMGIDIGRAELLLDAAKYSVGLYIASKNNVDSKFVLTAYDSKGVPQDNATLAIKQQAGKAQVHVFTFAYLKPGPSGYCILTKE
jgi:hypothetical protein